MIRYIKKNKILFCFTLIINLLTCLTPLFLAYIIENVSGIFLNQDESKITVSLWLIIAFMIYQALFSYLNSRYKAKYRQKLRADLSKDIIVVYLIKIIMNFMRTQSDHIYLYLQMM